MEDFYEKRNLTENLLVWKPGHPPKTVCTAHKTLSIIKLENKMTVQ